MTKPSLALVTSDTIPTQSSNGPTQEQKAIIADYVKALKKRGFCKIDDASSNQTRLLNRLNQKILPLSFIDNDFSAWLHRNEKECEYRSITYILRTLQHVIGSKFVPEDKPYVFELDTGCAYVNTYKAYKPSTESADVSLLFIEFFERLLPDKTERNIVLQWISHMFQHPEQRPSWHILMTSDTGTGKGFLVEEILTPLLHHTNVVADYSRVMGKMSSVLTDNLLILLDDCKAKSDATQTQLKSLLSEERAYIERKYAQGGMENTYARFILASNEHRPLHLDDSERRWYPVTYIVHKEDRYETQDFIGRLAKWLEAPGSLCKVYNYFKSYSLDGFNHKCVPESVVLASMIAMSKNPHTELIEDFIANHKVFTLQELKEAFTTEGMTPPNDKQIPHLLREAGYKSSKPRIDGKEKRLWHPIDMELEAIRAAWEEPEHPF